MKKLLLFTLILLGFTANVMAQNPNVIAIAESSKGATIESIAMKIDSLVEYQSAEKERLNTEIDNLNYRIQNSQNKASFHGVIRELFPIIVLAIIGTFFIFLTYILTMNNYRNNRLKYDAVLKCVESTGLVPDYFVKVTNRKSVAVPSEGRVSLVLSILCIITGTIFLIVALTSNYRSNYIENIICGGIGIAFAVASVCLFIQYSRISEKSRKEQ